MAKATRKRSAPPLSPVKDSSLIKDEHSAEMESIVSTSSSPTKRRCPVEGCEKTFTSLTNLRVHFRKHTQNKPYECTFPSCDQAFDDLTILYKHIRSEHQQQFPKMYVKVRKEILTEETKQLGIKECYTGEVYGEGMPEEDDNTTNTMPTLPPFTTIHRTSTGHLVCPFSECDQQTNKMVDLKNHYRIHGGRDYRPYKCVFPDESCQYAATEKKNVERHIRVKHFHLPRSIKKCNETVIDDDRNESDFVETRTDWLAMENALFSSAQIISSPDVQIPRTYECTFPICAKKFTRIDQLRTHIRSHLQLKPYSCSFPNCDQTSTRKEHILSHIHSAHFNVSRSMQKSLSKEEKQIAEQYIEVNQDVLDEEEAKMSSIRIRPRASHRRRKGLPTNTVSSYNSLDYCEVLLDYPSVSDEDDKDELSSFLITVQPTTSN